MRTSTMTAVLPAPVETVWDIVTNNNDTAWRSDLSRVDVKEGGNAFVEVTKQGMETSFRITCKDPCKHYAFTLENDMIQGDWTGEFSAVGGGTKIVFTERVRTKKWLLGFLAYLMPLKSMQNQYIEDLRLRLEL